MANRFTRGAAVVTGAVLAFGTAGMMMAGAAGATIVSTGNPAAAGYQAGNGSWNFRYVTTTLRVPQNCGTNSPNPSPGGDFRAGGVELRGNPLNSASNFSTASLAVVCNGGTPRVYWGTQSLYNVHFGGLIVAFDDNVQLSIYYDQTTGYDYFYSTDLTTGNYANWAHKAGVAEYHYAAAGEYVNNPLLYPPAPGTNYIQTYFSATGVTSYNGTHGTGLNGPWGVQQVVAQNGAHIIAQAPVLFDNGSSFNVRVYGS
jgi:hypothetical protein